MKEIWKIYYQGPKVTYEVSNLGNVKRNGELIDFSYQENKKYYTVSWYSVHKMVASLFVPNPDNKQCVDHINTDKHDNRAVNLSWVTYKENNNNPLTRKHMSESTNHNGIKNPMYGKNHTDKTIKLMQKNRKGRTVWNAGLKLMTDGYDDIYVKPEHWGEFIDIGFTFVRKYPRNIEYAVQKAQQELEKR